jgi:sterol desaturase/sphingolipid hydroxylase (fatty acid hydroxylase superfamily)
MTGSEVLSQTGLTLVAIVLAMLLVTLLELALPVLARGPKHRAHLVPNLTLTLITFTTNAFYNVGLVLLLTWLEARQLGLLRWLTLPSWVQAAVGFVLLDFTFYVLHVGMHKLPALWRVHKVHHSDAALDVTTALRQHPLEGVVRYAAMAALGCLLGVGVGTFALYRVASALNGLLEHANVRVPERVDHVLSWLTTWFGTHRIHHSREPRETDSNYGNIFSGFDRLFGTFTPTSRAKDVQCGLAGHEAPAMQTAAGLLAMPFSKPAAPLVPGAHVRVAST